MYQLIIAVLSISLMALVVSGGASYMSPDWGSRRVATDVAVLSYQSFDAALSAYRLSNGGALPPIAGNAPASLGSNAMPWPVLRPYLGARGDASSRVVSLAPFPGMDWYYTADSAGGVLCLASRNGSGDEPVPQPIREGLNLSARRASVAYVGRACLNQDDSVMNGGGAFAVTYRVQSGA